MNKQAVYYKISNDTYSNITELSNELGITMTNAVEGSINDTHRWLDSADKLLNGNPLDRAEIDLIYRLLFTYGEYMNKHLKSSFIKALYTQLDLLGTTTDDIEKVEKLIGIR